MRIILISNPKFWCLENPIGRLVNYLGKPKMYFHPYEYGDPYTKKTCLWGQFNIPKKHLVEPVKKISNLLYATIRAKNNVKKYNTTRICKSIFLSQ